MASTGTLRCCRISPIACMVPSSLPSLFCLSRAILATRPASSKAIRCRAPSAIRFLADSGLSGLLFFFASSTILFASCARLRSESAASKAETWLCSLSITPEKTGPFGFCTVFPALALLTKSCFLCSISKNLRLSSCSSFFCSSCAARR